MTVKMGKSWDLLGINTGIYQFQPLQYSLQFIEIKYFDSSRTSGCSGQNQPVFDFKMLVPIVLAGIEKTNDHFFIFQNRSEVGAFVGVANWASVGEVFKGGLAAVFEADDMFDWNLTIAATSG